MSLINKKILSLLLAVAMLVGLFPVGAFATTTEAQVEDQAYQEEPAQIEAELLHDLHTPYTTELAIVPLSGPITVTNEAQLRAAITAGNSPITINNTIRLTQQGFGIALDNRTITLQGNGTITSTVSTNNHFIVRSGSHLTLNGNLTLNSEREGLQERGGISVISGGRLTMNSGTITGNRDGIGVIRVSEGSTFTMNGGTIRNNDGASSVSVSGTFTMSGNSTIRNNATTAVRVPGGTFRMISGEIHNNTTGSSGGGVEVWRDGTFIMDGGAIRHNTATRSGGGVSLSDNSTMRMNNGAIHNNIADRYGGGIQIGSYESGSMTTSFAMHGGSIHNNRAERSGGGIAFSGPTSGTANIQRGEIRNNTAAGNGGGIFTPSYTNLTTSANTQFSGNRASRNYNFGVENRGVNMEVTRGGEGNPRNILWASVSLPNTHALNNYDVNFGLSFNVTFNLNGGTGTFPTQRVRDGEQAIEPETVPTREGHSFRGWFNSSFGDAAFDFSLPTTGNRTAHAQWVPYRVVTFDLHGGSGNFPPISVPSGTMVPEPAENPTREGYRFTGWFTAATGTARFNFNAPITSNRTAHARWVRALPTDRTVTFVLHGGTGNFPAQILADGGRAIEPATPPTRPDYIFVAWYTEATGGVPFQFTNPITADTTLHARWAPVPLPDRTVTFNLHGGTGNFPLTQTVADSQTATVPTPNPTREGYTFVGWYTAATGGVPFDFLTRITMDRTLHARWTEGAAISHTVTFNLHGGTGNFPVQTIPDGGRATAPTTNPTRAGYTFGGWYTAATGGTRFAFSNTITADTTLHARWTTAVAVVSHTVTFDLNGGTGSVPAQTVADGGRATMPTTNPTQEGYVFDGWFVAVPGGPRFDFDTPITADTTIYARWLHPDCDCDLCDCYDCCDCPAISAYESHLAYMFGDNRGNFRPGADITRAEVAAILARTQLLDFARDVGYLPPDMERFDTFSDVGAGDWFYYYVAWAYDAGLVRGDGNRFRPNDPISREEAAAMFARTAEVTPEGDIPFYDEAGISSWARCYVYTVYSRGLMVGSANYFRPTTNISRAEIATGMNRILGRLDSRSAFDAAEVLYLENAHEFPDVDATAWYFPSVLAAANAHRLTRDSDGAIARKVISG